MESLTLPRILNIPAKLLPIVYRFNDYRICLLEGGRGGSKSHSLARFLLFLAEKYQIRIVCGRETQNSISESVHALLSDLINQYGLNFEIQQARITHRMSGSTFAFIGLREQGRFNIQGLEAIDILWIEEGQAITKPTMDVVLPTIRKPNSKIFISMNRHVHNDPAYSLTHARPDCLHISINYLENEHCTQELINEADICRGQSQKDYDHIWLGHPLDQSEDALFGLDELTESKNSVHLLSPGYGIRVGGFDIARFGDDKCCAFVLQQMGALHWEEVYVDEWENKDLNYTTGRILQITNEYGIDMCAIDEDGLGAGPFDVLSRGRNDNRFVGFRNPPISYAENKNYGNTRTVNAYKLKDLVMKRHVRIKDQATIDELMTLRYEFDHNQRRILVSKDKMRRDGVKSPNRADALIMATSLIGVVKDKQERQYEPTQNSQYSREDNLFKIAGV